MKKVGRCIVCENTYILPTALQPRGCAAVAVKDKKGMDADA